METLFPTLNMPIGSGSGAAVCAWQLRDRRRLAGGHRPARRRLPYRHDELAGVRRNYGAPTSS